MFLSRPYKIKWFSLIAIVVSLLLWFTICLPNPLFNDCYSVVLNDRDGNLLSAKIAQDGQWRFPESKKLNHRFVYSMLAFEDEYFFSHPGVNPLSIWRAFRQNQKAGKIVSGGSTITMQLTRLMRKNQKRTYLEKLLELFLALRLELTYSKDEIFRLYASHAPFGTNVVGAEAASWRYFGRPLSNLSWAECAALAVLPNSPSIIYPGKNQGRLRLKRNRLLLKLFQSHYISKDIYQLALEEPLPEKPFPLPDRARHLLNRAKLDHPGENSFTTSLQSDIHNHVTEILSRHGAVLKQNEIHNVCALVLDVNKQEVVSYVGNTPLRDKEKHGEDVDVIRSRRSTGSLLKPYLYGFMLNDGELLPNMLVPDVPTQIAGYVPQNFDFTYDGAVPARKALARSLNIPAVKMLQQYTIEKFLDRLHQIGIASLNRSVDDYGLSLILGGGEASLWEMCSAYSLMAAHLNSHNRLGKHVSDKGRNPHYLLGEKKSFAERREVEAISPGSIWLMLEAMAEVSRPDIDASWQRLGNAQKIAWKTGTSYGFRDGWAIGISPDYVVGVWVGNADGEGRPGLTGISAAAPVLFEIFGMLPKSSWFEVPVNDLKVVDVCKQSGYPASQYCPERQRERIPKNSHPNKPCSYHKPIHVDSSGQYRVTDACESPLNMKTISWFILPPVQEYYYRTKNPLYKSLPPYRSGCVPDYERSMEMVYPKAGTIIYIPYELTGEQGKTVFEVAHRQSSNTIFWHLDGMLIGSTRDIHQMGMNPSKGKHMLSLSDNMGETLNIPFEVVSERK